MEDNTNTDNTNTDNSIIYNTVYNKDKEYKQYKNNKPIGSIITPFFYIYNLTPPI